MAVLPLLANNDQDFFHFISPLIPVLGFKPLILGLIVHCSITVLALLVILVQTFLPFFSLLVPVAGFKPLILGL